MDIVREFGQRMRVARGVAGLTQSEVAARAGIHRVTLAEFEAARSSPTVKVLARIAAALGVQPRDLFPLQTARAGR